LAGRDQHLWIRRQRIWGWNGRNWSPLREFLGKRRRARVVMEESDLRWSLEAVGDMPLVCALWSNYETRPDPYFVFDMSQLLRLINFIWSPLRFPSNKFSLCHHTLQCTNKPQDSRRLEVLKTSWVSESPGWSGFDLNLTHFILESTQMIISSDYFQNGDTKIMLSTPLLLSRTKLNKILNVGN
jgi:hypothetical protein